MDYSFNKAASSSFDYMNSTDLFSNKNEFIYMPCHSSNSSSSSSSSSSIFATIHDPAHGGSGPSSADDYFNINYENNNPEYNTDLLLFDSNDGTNMHLSHHLDHGMSIEMIKNERDFNFVFENLFETGPGFSSSTPLSHSQSLSDSMSMSSLTTLNPVVHGSMSSLLLSPTSMVDSAHAPLHDEIVAAASPAFDSDKENGGLRLPCYLAVSDRDDHLASGVQPGELANNDKAAAAAAAADTRRTRNMPSRDQVTGRFKNSSSAPTTDITTVVDSNSSSSGHHHQALLSSADAGGLTKPAASRKSSSKRSRSLANNPNRRKRTKFTHEQIEILEKCFSRDTKYPDSSVIENLACRTHLDFHTITIWFQNRRSKDKKMKKN